MWSAIARTILSYRLVWLGFLVMLTGVMAYFGTRLQLSYQIARVLPLSDSTQFQYERFKERFGADGTLMVIGWQSDRWFDLPVYQGWYQMTEQVGKLQGVRQVLSSARMFNLQRNDSTWGIRPVVTRMPQTQAEVDSLKTQVLSLPFYEGLLINPATKATLMAITFDEQKLNSRARIELVQTIREYGKAFAEKNNIELHYSGLPSIRTEVMKKVSGEMKLFMGLAAAFTGLMVWLLFRSGRVVWLSMTVVAIGVCVAVGTLSLLGYEITLLTGLIPPLLIVIGVPNCVFLINKYHEELAEHGDKQRALEVMIRQIGLSALLANVTTAIGFGVFYFTNSRLLMEFGVVAAICVMAVYVVCLLMVPILLSYLPVPKAGQLQTLQGGRWRGVLSRVDYWVHNRRGLVYGLVTVITVLSSLGMFLIRVEGYVVDDLPKNDPVYTDLRFIEQQFKGALPLEVMIDTGEPNGVFAEAGRALYKVRALERVMDDYPEFSKPRSLVDAIRFGYQTYRGGNPKYYVLPPAMELKKMVGDAPLTGKASATSSLAQSFLDSSRQITRVSYQMADVGSIRMQEVLGSLRPRIDSVFAGTGYKVSLTGHSLVFLQSNDYLLGNLYESLLIAIILIALVGMVLFRSIPIILLSKLPCLIPLVVTAGIMGYAGIPFKPSTILIFSIAFGLASDGTVYFLTSYRRQLQLGLEPPVAISAAISETGISLIYTALILAVGFAVFAASSFGGTAALGVLVATTVLMACLTNLVLLPALLLTLKRYRV
ncbi:MMPL family transporter [Rudanella paleaurantiibacter]|uniref:MMPL family transporter n=1 Tax=Rudanella paleaurantiibacter TaxID=2614655 RepID=A0A7J5TY82_9BACT|nr:MMPL family transporter [Rudanella paleaurantiibacter]KAB7730098.1 MMPL family transporter [Rudanella paleaurantiibacter]